MLVKRSKIPTNYYLPVIINGFKTNWYYNNEYLVFKAYYQLLAMKCKIKPLYPIVIENELLK